LNANLKINVPRTTVSEVATFHQDIVALMLLGIATAFCCYAETVIDHLRTLRNKPRHSRTPQATTPRARPGKSNPFSEATPAVRSCCQVFQSYSRGYAFVLRVCGLRLRSSTIE